jgi:hypothetical protein
MNKITPKESATIMSRLGKSECPACHFHSRGILPFYFGAPSLDLENGLDASNVLPLVAVMCEKCGKVDFYNADFLLRK